MARNAGKSEGKMEEQIRLVTKKVQKGQKLNEIAEILEQEPEELKEIYSAVVSAAPGYDADQIYKKLADKKF